MPNDVVISLPSTDPRLKRNIRHDSRARELDTRRLTLSDVEWLCAVGILDQGSVGDCTAEAGTQVLSTSPLWPGLPSRVQALILASVVDQGFEKTFYHLETVAQGGPTYPGADPGSDGLTSAKVAKANAWIGSYQHTFSTDALLKGMQVGACSWGTLWKTGMDDVDESTGQIRYTGTTRGGHQLILNRVDAKNERAWGRQSWGAWGYQRGGTFWISFDDLAKSLAEQGDATFFLPPSGPPPIPPIPPVPVSVDQALWTATKPWAGARHVGSNKAAAQAVTAWAAAKGLT